MQPPSEGCMYTILLKWLKQSHEWLQLYTDLADEETEAWGDKVPCPRTQILKDSADEGNLQNLHIVAV